MPTRPGVHKPPKPGPKKQSEVDEDYSNVKAPNQIGLPTFWNSVEPYLREIREDDLAMLGFKVGLGPRASSRLCGKVKDRLVGCQPD